MRVVFRVDSSAEIGLGHIIRCLAVARELRNFYNVIFAVTADPTNSLIIDAGYELFLKNNDEREEDFLIRTNKILVPDRIVLDKKYPYSIETFNSLKGKDNVKIIIIDNVCEGMAATDEIIFPTAHLDKNTLKNYLSKEQIKKVKTGFEYVILRDEIIEAKKNKRSDKRQNNKIPNIVVTTGGSDPEGILLHLIPWFKDMDIDAKITILVGHSFKYRSELENLIVDLPENIIIKPYSVEELIKGDLAICTFGVSIYELIYLQIPAICISHNKENAAGSKNLCKKCKIFKDLGYVNYLNYNMFLTSIENALEEYKHLNSNMIVIDGYGIKKICDLIKRL